MHYSQTMTNAMDLQTFLQRAQEIKSPQERILPQIQTLLNSSQTVVDAHCHIFDKHCVPLPFLERHFPKNNILKKLFGHISDWKFTDIDDFIKILSYNSMHDIIEYYHKYNAAPNTVLMPLMMDMQFGWDDHFPKRMYQQIAEIKNLMKTHPLLPFFAIDPRQIHQNKPTEPNLYDNFITAFTGEYPFSGIKVYPSLGFLPSDPLLLPIYEVCVQKNIPITTHCGVNIVNTFNKSVTVTGTKLVNGNRVEYFEELDKNYFAKGAELAHPKHWHEVLKMFPQLKLNLAHYGGHFEWKLKSKWHTPEKIGYINKLIAQYDHVYTDFSYSLTSTWAVKNLKKEIQKNTKLQSRLLYGTDYHLVLIGGNLQKSIANFKSEMEPHWNSISRENANAFIGIK